MTHCVIVLCEHVTEQHISPRSMHHDEEYRYDEQGIRIRIESWAHNVVFHSATQKRSAGECVLQAFAYSELRLIVNKRLLAMIISEPQYDIALRALSTRFLG